MLVSNFPKKCVERKIKLIVEKMPSKNSSTKTSVCLWTYYYLMKKVLELLWLSNESTIWDFDIGSVIKCDRFSISMDPKNVATRNVYNL